MQKDFSLIRITKQADSIVQDQTARYVQSDRDPCHLQKSLFENRKGRKSGRGIRLISLVT